MIRTRLSCVSLCILAGAIPYASLFAHVNTIIDVKDKTLVGLPKQYSPAELDLEAFRLRIGQHVVQFPSLLKTFFTRQPYDLQVSASWYHDNPDGSAPPYLNLEITPKGRDYTYIVSFALDTLHLQGIWVNLRGSRGPPETFTMQTLQIALTEFEKKEFNDAVKDVR
jgi:hypothetical protein